MAYDASKLRMVQPLGIHGDGPNLFLYRSSEAATDIVGAGYFTGAGAGGRYLSSNADRNKGMKYGDVVMNVESSLGASPGRVSMHSVIGSTADQASTAASTGWVTAYNVTVSAHAST